jgi:hypothetical protein
MPSLPIKSPIRRCQAQYRIQIGDLPAYQLFATRDCPCLGRGKFGCAPGFPDNPHRTVQKNDKSITIRGGDFFILSLKGRSIFERQLHEDQFAATLFGFMDNLRVCSDGESIWADAGDRRHFRCGLRPFESGDCQR